MDEDFIELAPRDYKAYVGYFTSTANNEVFTISVHVPCGALVASRQTHLKVCPAVEQ